MSLTIDILLSVLLPAALGFGLVGLGGRLGGAWRQVLLGLAMPLAVGIAFRVLQGRWPFVWDGDLPPAQDWLFAAAALGALIGIVRAGVPRTTLHPLSVLVVAAAAWVVVRTGHEPASAAWLAGLCLASAAGGAGLEVAARRLPALGAAIVLLAYLSGAATLFALAHVASYAQLVGAVAAVIGGAAVWAVFRRPVSWAAAAPVVALVAVTGASAAHHFADLSEAAMWGIVLAPVLLLGLLAPLSISGTARSALATACVVAALAGLGTVAVAEPEPAAEGSVDSAIDDAYDSLDLGGSGPDYSTLPKTSE